MSYPSRVLLCTALFIVASLILLLGLTLVASFAVWSVQPIVYVWNNAIDWVSFRIVTAISFVVSLFVAMDD